MALIKCPGCEGKVSSTADACPKCGHKLTEEDKQKALETTKTLIECPECEEEVSTIADACSNLDTQEFEKKTPSAKPWYKKWRGIALVITLLIVASFSILMYWRGSAAKKAEMAEIVYGEGYLARENDDYERAIEAFKKALSLGHPHAKGQLGLTMYIMDNEEEGLRLMREAVSEGSPYNLVDLASNLLRADEFAQYVEEGNKLMTEAYDTGHWYPAYAWADYYLDLAIDEKNLDEAEKYIDTAEKYIDEAVKRGAASEGLVIGLKEGIISVREEKAAERELMPDYTITKIYLFREYDKNALITNEKFIGKKIRISNGIANIIDRDTEGKLYIGFNMYDEAFYPALVMRYIKFSFEESAAGDLAALKAGQNVVIQGTFLGKNENVLFFEKCWIVK